MSVEKRGIVVLGHPRSGTTLLRRILNGHSGIASPPETHLLSACARFLEDERTAHGVDVGVLAGLNFAGFEDEELLSELRQFAFGFLQKYADGQGKARWAEKTAFDSFHIDKIEKMCAGHAQFVAIVRHPLDVAISTRDFCDSMGMYPSVLHHFIKEHQHPIDAFAHSWLSVNQKIENFCARHPSDSILIRYEDLIAKPDETLERLMSSLGERHEPGTVSRGLSDKAQLGFGDHKSYQTGSLTRQSIDRWKALPEYQIGKLASELNPMLTRLGYEPLRASEDDGVVDARRKYVQGLNLLSKREMPAAMKEIHADVEPRSPHIRWYGNKPVAREKTGTEVSFLLSGQQSGVLGIPDDPGSLTELLSAALVSLLARATDETGLAADVHLLTDKGENDGEGSDFQINVQKTGEDLEVSWLLKEISTQFRSQASNGHKSGFGVASEPVLKLDCRVSAGAVTEGNPGILPETSAEMPDELALTVHEGVTASGYDVCVTADMDVNSRELKVSILLDKGCWPTGARAERTARHFLRLMTAIARGTQKYADEIDLLAEDERELLFPETTIRTEPVRRVIDQFVECAKERPGHLAVACGTTRLTYSELAGRVYSLSAALRRQGVSSGDLVAVCVARSADMITALLAVMHAGGVYVPIDPDHPTARINQILDDADPTLLLSETGLYKNLGKTFDGRVICLDDGSWQEEAAVEERCASGDLAYIIFTSGSTGRPKGVEVRHHGLSTFLEAMKEAPGLTSGDRMLSVTTVAFDIAALELFLPLISGATVFLAMRRETVDPQALISLLEDNQISVMQATPATFRILISGGWTGNPKLKLLCGGEAFPPDLVHELLSRSGELWNMYGPTETTIWSTVKKLTSAQTPTPIGRPIAGTRAYVLNEKRVPVPVGVTGELYIAGDGVAAGYHKRAELTQEKFMPDVFCTEIGQRMYRTGDLARVKDGGDLEYLGRLDNQVKVRGFRIELGDIETAITGMNGVNQCVVNVSEPSSRQKILVAYVVPESSGHSVTVQSMRDHLNTRLPEYMVPAALVLLDALPLTPNNKVDRKSLPEPQAADFVSGHDAEKTETALPVQENTDLTEKIIGDWERIMGVSPISADSSFVSLGGDSLSFVQAAMTVEEAIGRLPENWEELSIRQLAAEVSPAESKSAEVDTTVFVRALAISMIVLLHAKVGYGFHGASSGLLMIAGFLFARFQLNQISGKNSAMPIVWSALQFLIPATLYMALLQFATGDINLGVLLLYSNFTEYSGVYWFIQCLAQFLLLMFLIFLAEPLRKFAAEHSLRFAAALLGVAGIILALSGYYMSSDHAFAYQLPNVRLWQFVFGWCVLFCSSGRSRLALTGALLGLSSFEYAFFQTGLGRDYLVVTVAFGLVLLFIPRITVNRPLHYVVYGLAGASLFIFLSHMQFFTLTDRVLPGAPEELRIPVALLGGYVLWRGWEFGIERFRSFMTQLRQPSRET